MPVVVPSFSIAAALITALWLGRYGRGRGRLARGLYLIVLWELGRLGAAFFLLPDNGPLVPFLYHLSQLLSWLLLGWSLEIDRRLALAGVIVVAGALWFAPETAANLVGWGLVTALPLAGLVYLRERRMGLPIIPIPANPARRQRTSSRKVTAEGGLDQQRPILECIADGVIVNNIAGQIEYINETAAGIIGLNADNLTGKPVTEVITRLPIPRYSDDPEQSTTQSQFEINGRMIQSQMNIIYNQDGAIQGTVAILRDITAEYQSERSKNAFLTTVSHELRTPLTAIKGYVELLANGTAGQLSANQKMFIETIQRNVARMIQMINTLIFISSMRGGKLEFTPGYTDLRRIVDQIVRELHSMAEANKVHIEVDIDSRLQPIQADPIHLSTIMQELVSNGLKYNRPGGKVAINIALQEDPEQQFVVVSIIDNGIGIAPADREHIFEDFYRLDRQDIEIQAGGMGMGLTIVRALIEAYNGRIWVDSALDEGTTVTFILPTSQVETIPELPDQP